jgi:hypothetical protein
LDRADKDERLSSPAPHTVYCIGTWSDISKDGFEVRTGLSKRLNEKLFLLKYMNVLLRNRILHDYLLKRVG